MKGIPLLFLVHLGCLGEVAFAEGAPESHVDSAQSVGREPIVSPSASSDVVVLKPFLVDFAEFEKRFPTQTKEYWDQQVRLVRVGMTRAQVFAILRPAPLTMLTTITGSTNCCEYPLDSSWTVNMCFSNEGGEMENRLIRIPIVSSGGWNAITEKKKEAEPGATDNPGDAQRLREDH